MSKKPIAIPGRVNTLIWHFRKDRACVAVLAYLLLFDIAFISIHIIRGVMKERGAGIEFLASSRFSLLQDQGYAEWFNYTSDCVHTFNMRLDKKEKVRICRLIAHFSSRIN